jgi:hypothetical protein
VDLSPVAAEYIRTHRADCSDAEIRKALKDQGFSDEALADAFHAAGDRPPAPRRNGAPFLRGLVWTMAAASALLFLAAALLLIRNLTRAP